MIKYIKSETSTLPIGPLYKEKYNRAFLNAAFFVDLEIIFLLE